jgi:hypothetical protein
MLIYQLTIYALVSMDQSIIRCQYHFLLKGKDLHEILDQFNDKIIIGLEDQDTTILNIALQELPNE